MQNNVTSYRQSGSTGRQALALNAHPPVVEDDEDEQVESEEEDDVADGNDDYRASSSARELVQGEHENGIMGQSTSAAAFHGQAVQQPIMASTYGYPVMPMAYPLVAPSFMPYFLTPPYHNPYSPTGGTGHLHPPHISQNSYSTSTVPPLSPSTAISAGIQGPGEALTHPNTSYDTPDADDSDDQRLEGSPPNKRARRTNAVDEEELQNRSIDELYFELPPPPPVEDPDPDAPPNSHPGRVPYQKFQCKMCDAKFPRRNAAVAHIKTHLGKRRFTCSHEGCTAAFVREHDCKRHELTHTATRNFTCHCGRPFARPDALRRHKEKGHCGLAAKSVPASGAQELDPTWTEGRPVNPAPSGAAAAKQAGIAYPAEDHASLLVLNRQLHALGRVTPVVSPPTFSATEPSDPGGQDDVDGEAVEESHSVDRHPNDVRAPNVTSTNKSAKRVSSRAQRPLPEIAHPAQADAHAVTPAPESSVTISTAVPDSRTQSTSIYDSVFGTSSYPSGTVVPPGAASFLPFLQMAPQNTTATASTIAHQQGHALASTSFAPSSGGPYPAGFMSGPSNFTYSTENGYSVAASSTPGVIPASFPLSGGSTNTASGTISQPSFPATIGPNVAGPTGPGTFSRPALPPANSDPARRYSQTEVNSIGTRSTAKVGMSLVEIAVDAATRAQQYQQQQQEREALARAQSEQYHPHPNHFGGIGGVQSGGNTHIDGIELDMRDVVDDLDGTDVAETAMESIMATSSGNKAMGKKKAKPRTSKATNGASRNGLRTRSKATAAS
ncbi:hypothetical protein FRB90_006174 [Tulasnella sp. 427]|nr:hypothetical protein FRB90_006174 [Tulasnella sp. 427]